MAQCSKTISNNNGIGTMDLGEKLEAEGGVKLGSNTNQVAGNMRWKSTESDFEGYNGTEWYHSKGVKVLMIHM